MERRHNVEGYEIGARHQIVRNRTKWTRAGGFVIPAAAGTSRRPAGPFWLGVAMDRKSTLDYHAAESSRSDRVVSRREAAGAATFSFQRDDATMNSPVIGNFQKLALGTPMMLQYEAPSGEAKIAWHLRRARIRSVVASLR